jgi:hypothetical protein
VLLLLSAFARRAADFDNFLARFSLNPFVAEYKLQPFYYYLFLYEISATLLTFYWRRGRVGYYIWLFLSFLYSGFILLYLVDITLIDHYCLPCTYVPTFFGEGPLLTAVFALVVFFSSVINPKRHSSLGGSVRTG